MSETWRRLDELVLNAWPAWQTVLLDGWLLRYAGGYTKRANSVNALYAGSLPLVEKIEGAERFYRDRGLPAVFRLAAFSQPAGLETALVSRGYEHLDQTLVQTLSLAETGTGPVDGLALLPLAEWMAVYRQFGGQDVETAARHQALLSQILALHGLFVLAEGGEVAGCGVGVLDSGYFGLFDVITAAARRRQGYGRRLVAGMLAWAAERGARQAILQVMSENEPARQLYAGFGFETAYEYWYRRKRW